MKIMKVHGSWISEEGEIQEQYILMTPEKFIEFCTNFANCTEHHDGDKDFSVEVLEVVEVDET